MPVSILATKVYVPLPRPKAILRFRLTDRLDDVLHRKLTLVSAPAGFGKSTLVSEWLASRKQPAAWLSLDKEDGDRIRFLTYFAAAVQAVAAAIGSDVVRVLQSPQPPSTESVLAHLLNDIAAAGQPLVFVLDDYHVTESAPVDQAVTYLLEHMPPHMHLIIATREDPQLPLARLRARGQLAEIRALDLRFTPVEASEFLNEVMGLGLSPEDVSALETRTEGWIAGLQLAAISMKGHEDAAGFIKSFTGSHSFVTDYLLQEVLQRQPEHVQAFLLRTSILDRLCGPLCDAVLGDPSASGQQTLEYLERANLFVVPLDNERRWYRYHHLFAELLRQRLQQSTAFSSGDAGSGVAVYHIRACEWYEHNGLELEAFHHAAAAHDVERAERLIDGGGIPLHFRGAVAAVRDWLASLPTAVLSSRPSLWATYASTSLVMGQTTGVEEKLQAAESAMRNAASDDKTRNLVGRIAAARATLALTQYRVEGIVAQSRRALEYLRADDLPFRFVAIWTLAFAHLLQGDRAAAGKAYAEALSISHSTGDVFSALLAMGGVAQVQELENHLAQAAETNRRVLELVGDLPLPNACEPHLGLARILYEWNDLDAAEQHAQQSIQLARQYDAVIDRFIISEVFLAHLRLGRGDVTGAAAILARADQSVRQHEFVHRIPEVAAAQVLTLLRQGNLAAAARLAQMHKLPMSQARVHLAQGNPSKAREVLKPWRQQVEARGWVDEQLKVLVLESVVLHALGEKDKAVNLLGDALALAQPGGFVRLFVDEGAPMAQLLSEAEARGMMPDYTRTFTSCPWKRVSAAISLDRPTVDRGVEPPRIGSVEAHCPGTLEQGNRRPAFCQLEHRERA